MKCLNERKLEVEDVFRRSVKHSVIDKTLSDNTSCCFGEESYSGWKMIFDISIAEEGAERTHDKQILELWNFGRFAILERQTSSVLLTFGLTGARDP